MTPLFAAYESAKDRMNLTYPQFAQAFKAWEVMPVKAKGNLAGAILWNGNELHCCILPEFHKRWLVPSIYKEILHTRLERFGSLITKVNKHSRAGKQFVTKAGFQHIETQGDTLIYELRYGN